MDEFHSPPEPVQAAAAARHPAQASLARIGLLGIAMATGLAIVLRAGIEIPEDYWRSIIDYPTTAQPPASPRRHSRPASA